MPRRSCREARKTNLCSKTRDESLPQPPIQIGSRFPGSHQPRFAAGSQSPQSFLHEPSHSRPLHPRLLPTTAGTTSARHAATTKSAKSASTAESASPTTESTASASTAKYSGKQHPEQDGAQRREEDNQNHNADEHDSTER